MPWNNLSLKERHKLYKQARSNDPSISYYRVRQMADGGKLNDEDIAGSFSLPEVNIYPQNRWGDIARREGLQTARNWQAVKNAVGTGRSEFINHPVAQGVMAALPLPTGLEAASNVAVKVPKVLKNLTKEATQAYYKHAPWTWKPNPNNFYRAGNRAIIDDALESGVIRRREAPKSVTVKGFTLTRGSGSKGAQTYFNKGVPLSDTYRNKYGANVPNYGDYVIEADGAVPFVDAGPKGRIRNINTPNEQITGSAIPRSLVEDNIPLQVDKNIRFLQPDWFRGYKEIPKYEDGGPIGKVKSFVRSYGEEPIERTTLQQDIDSKDLFTYLNMPSKMMTYLATTISRGPGKGVYDNPSSVINEWDKGNTGSARLASDLLLDPYFFLPIAKMGSNKAINQVNKQLAKTITK